MSHPYSDARPIWIQAAEQNALERALDTAIAAEFEESSLDDFFDEVSDVVVAPALRTPCWSLPRRRGASRSPSWFTLPDGAAPRRRRPALPPAARSP